jgi:hypothetical protein
VQRPSLPGLPAAEQPRNQGPCRRRESQNPVAFRDGGSRRPGDFSATEAMKYNGRTLPGGQRLAEVSSPRTLAWRSRPSVTLQDGLRRAIAPRLALVSLPAPFPHPSSRARESHAMRHVHNGGIPTQIPTVFRLETRAPRSELSQPSDRSSPTSEPQTARPGHSELLKPSLARRCLVEAP